MTDTGNERAEHGMIAPLLRTAGLRVTPQRRAVLASFDGSGGHLTAEEVGARARQAVPELARATVYKALAELVRAGLLQVIEGPGAARYDANPNPNHQHFRCRQCGTLHDVDTVGLGAVGLREGIGFVVERCTVVFEGLCPACASPAPIGPPRSPGSVARSGVRP